MLEIFKFTITNKYILFFIPKFKLKKLPDEFSNNMQMRWVTTPMFTTSAG